jgi:hypothetical protein
LLLKFLNEQLQRLPPPPLLLGISLCVADLSLVLQHDVEQEATADCEDEDRSGQDHSHPRHGGQTPFIRGGEADASGVFA